MADLYLVKIAKNCFAPASETDNEAAKKFKEGDIYATKIWKKRNIKFHRKFFALIDEMFDMQEKYQEKKDFLVEIKLKCGHYEEHLTEKGNIIYVPKSISFEKMDEVEFEKLYNKAIDVGIRDYATGENAEELDFRINQLLGYV